MIKIIDNFLDKETHKKIYNILTKDESFPYFFLNGVADRKHNDFMFVHILYLHDKGINSKYFELIGLPLINKLSFKGLIRAKINCYSNQGEQIKNGFHTDYNTKHKVALYSVNTNNGYTEFENGDKYFSKENQIIIFDGNLKHRSVTQNDKHLRLNININYEL
jgi:hypothetical protein